MKECSTSVGQDGSGRSNGFSATLAGRELVQPDYRVRVDPVTGLLLRDPCLTDEELAFYYAHKDWRIHCSDRLFPTEVCLRRDLLEKLPAGAKVLDLGCGDGRFLNALPASYEKFGTELSEGAAATCSERGIKIIPHEDMIRGDYGDFDAIVMLDFFEHLKNPHTFIRSLLPRLKPGGLLGIATGNGDYRGLREDPEGFWYFRIIAHVCMWTEAYANFAAKDLALERLASRRCSHYRFRLREWCRQALQKLAYEVFQSKNKASLKRLLLLVPGLSRAKTWKRRPAYLYGRDHIVTVFQKSVADFELPRTDKNQGTEDDHP